MELLSEIRETYTASVWLVAARSEYIPPNKYYPFIHSGRYLVPNVAL